MMEKPAGTSNWTPHEWGDYLEGWRVWDDHDGRPLRAFPDMMVPLRLKQIIGKMRAQQAQLVKKRQAFHAGRVGGNIRRHEEHLAWLEANPHLMLTEEDLTTGAADEPDTSTNLSGLRE